MQTKEEPHNRSNIIIVIDPGTIITGYGIIKINRPYHTVIDYGCIRPPKEEKLSERYLILFNALNEILEKYRPHALAVETQFLSKNVQSTIKLGMARGIALIAAKSKGVAVYEYSPTRAKKAVVGNGKASKKQVQEMVKMLLQLSTIPEPEDASDALSLALCHANTLLYHHPNEMEI
jgi:crossover junction endodeoxyribonuclease RuvC